MIVPLTPQVLSILIVFVKTPGRSSAAIRCAIRFGRRCLRAAHCIARHLNGEDPIKTLSKRGYRFIAPVTRVKADDTSSKSRR